MTREGKILGVAAALGLFAFALYARAPGAPPMETPAAVSGGVRGTGEAAIGGPFQLLDTEGRPVSERDLLGRFALVYFGYANCPDVCPLDMARITLALEALSARLEWEEKLQPVFITVDPARDTPEALAAFLSHFHPAFIGLTGAPERVAEAARAYRVAVEAMQDREHHAAGLITHTSYIYLMGPDGKYAAHFGDDLAPAELAEALLSRLN